MDVKNVDRRLDCYELRFGRGENEDLLKEVKDMEENSEWTHGVTSSGISLEAIDGPLFAKDAADRYHLNYELALDTTENTCLMVNTGSSFELLRDTARSSLCETAKLSGSALGRMAPYLFAATINNGLSVARGSSLLLKRYGKISALHSNADGGYQIMPISKLLGITEDMIERRFGTGDFIEGYNTHGYTSAVWELPDAQEKILDIYKKALGQAGSKYPVNCMPALRFQSSDTAASCATLLPVFVYPKTGIGLPFSEGIRIKHTKRGSSRDAMEEFAEQADGMFARFEESAEEISRLSAVDIYNGCNTVVSICKKLNIAKKYGEAARVEMERLTVGGAPVTAHDVYLCMGEALADAMNSRASAWVVRNMEESIAKVPRLDWTEHDVGGVVAW